MDQLRSSQVQLPRLRFLWMEGMCLVAAIWSQLLHAQVSTVTFLALAVWALLSRERALQALTVSVLIAFLNPGLFPEQPYAESLRWIVVLAAAVKIYSEWFLCRRSFPGCVVLLFVFAFTETALSCVSSHDPLVSVLKLMAFLAGTSAVVLGFRLCSSQLDYWYDWFFTLLVVVLVSSVPLLASPVGYFTNSHGFQGILNHPQAYGSFIAPLVCLAAAVWLTGGCGVNVIGCVAVVGTLTLVESESRTAMLALILGFIVTVIVATIARRDWLSEFTSLLHNRTVLASACLAAAFAVWQAAAIKDGLVAFASKRHQVEEGISRSVLAEARVGVVETSWSNFVAHPITGIGFGVPSDPTVSTVQRDAVLGLPTSASVEKGFMPTAVLEESGLIGAALVILLLVALAGPVVLRGRAHVCWLFWACLLINCGEMVFFSMGGLGMQLWLVLGLANSSAACSHRRKGRYVSP
jgi:hypothetical protein